MSPSLPALTARDVLRALRKAGFTVARVRGSHHHLRHSGRPAARVVVPVHSGDLPPGTVRAIIKQAGLTEAAFLDLL
jgi:predicted RNA binding protein YcfA (HicA-like mRNA interferase family)